MLVTFNCSKIIVTFICSVHTVAAAGDGNLKDRIFSIEKM